MVRGSERDARRGWRLGGAGLAGAGAFRLLRCTLATETSAETSGGRGAAHRGGRGGRGCSAGGRRRTPAAAMAWWPRTARCGDPPGVGAAGLDAWWRCEDGLGVSDANEIAGDANFSKSVLPATARSEQNPGDGVAGLAEQRLGAALGAEAEPMRRSWRIGLWRGSEAAAARRAAGRSCAGVRARARMAAAWRGRVREGARARLKREGPASACGSRADAAR